MPTVLHDIAWRAMQVHGALGISNEMPFFGMIAGRRGDGPRRRADRGPQGHGGASGASRAPAERRPLADAAPPEAAGRRPRQVRRPTRARSGEPVIDIDRLADWMDGQGLPGKGEPIEHRYVSGGSQNEIYEIQRGELHGALRIPPPPAPAPRDDGIIREWRIIEALDGTDVPHTEAIAVCTDQSVLGRDFYLMGFVDGWSPMGMGDQLARAVRRRPRGPGRARPTSSPRASRCCRRSTGRPRASTTWGGPTASTSVRSTAGPRSSSASRAASCRASTRPRRGCGRTVRSTTSPASCTATTSSPT